MVIKPLSKENIEDAIQLLHSIFIEDVRVGEAPSGALWASLEPKKHKEFYKKHNIKDLEYFVILDERVNEVIGTTNPVEAAAQSVYEKFGFKVVGREKRSPNHKYTTLYRERKL